MALVMRRARRLSNYLHRFGSIRCLPPLRREGLGLVAPTPNPSPAPAGEGSEVLA
jgi:hypothetical protein